MILSDLIRQSVFAAIIASVVSCGYQETISIRTDRTHEVAIKDLCRTKEVIPLWIPDSLRSLVPSVMKLEVGDGKVFILDNTATGLLAFTLDGSFVTRIADCGHINDFSTYDGKSLEVLSGTGDLTSYSLDDLSVLRRHHLDNVKGVRLCAMHRFADDLYVMTGYLDGLNYFCEYYVGNGMFSVSMDEITRIAHDRNVAQIIGNSRFFDHDGRTFMLYPHSGAIWEDSYMTYSTGEKVGPFVHPVYTWDFGDMNESVDAVISGDCDFSDARLFFDNAQMSDDCLFMSFLLDGKHRLLILDKNKRKAKTVKSKDGNIPFPLGIIRGNVNYWCCTEAALPYYCLPPETGNGRKAAGLYLLSYPLE